MSIGTAKPIPTLPSDWPPDSICELIPITRPSASSSGPPELPGLIGASVWIALEIVNPFGALIWRWTAETIPAVAVRSRPNGLPIATTGSPTLTPGRGAELERLQLVGAGVDLEHGDVGGRVRAEDLGVEGLAVLAADADGDVVGAGDDVGVGEDVAVVVDDEAGAGGGAALRLAEGVERRGLRPSARP